MPSKTCPRFTNASAAMMWKYVDERRKHYNSRPVVRIESGAVKEHPMESMVENEMRLLADVTEEDNEVTMTYESLPERVKACEEILNWIEKRFKGRKPRKQ